MRKRVVILGGGTGGTLVANRLRRALGSTEVDIVIVDRDDRHIYQPGLLFVPFGMAVAADLVRSRSRQLQDGIEFRHVGVDRVELEANEVVLEDGGRLGYDVLVVASGAVLRPEETDGLGEALRTGAVHSFYSLEGSSSLAGALAAFGGGRLVVNVVDMPIKCPVAPIEFSFLADWYFRQRGIRDKVDLIYATPLDGVFTKEVANRQLSGLLGRKGVQVLTEFNTGEVDAAGRRLVSFDGREIPFDLAVVVPLHGGAEFVDRSVGLGSEFGFVPADEATLQSKARPNVFVLGDAADLPVSKAGSVAHFEGDVLARNLKSFLAGEPLASRFDGHTNCFIESGFGKALLIDYNYDIEPVTGHYPSRLGLPLLKESRLNHIGKLAFQQLYWHGLLPGHDIPGISTLMPRAGKCINGLAEAG